MAPSGNQAATEKTNLNLYHSENPVYSPKLVSTGGAYAPEQLKEEGD